MYTKYKTGVFITYFYIYFQDICTLYRRFKNTFINFGGEFLIPQHGSNDIL